MSKLIEAVEARKYQNPRNQCEFATNDGLDAAIALIRHYEFKGLLIDECREAFEEWMRNRGQKFTLQHWMDEGYAESTVETLWNGWKGSWHHRAPLLDEITALRKAKDAAYSERNKLVAALSKLFPAWLERHPDSAWEDDWRWIVFLDLPVVSGSGQVSWHIHDSELSQFDHLERRSGNSWDDHTTEEKYLRLACLRVLAGQLQPSKGSANP
ncbi:WDGH domain-containing protein [Zavarzinella formosa]|uniref:WDGH domain-containing protein n=1 Tax=Zavarzinella formosa TaxID=360055 RepID=UPI0005933771|nr:hypothetical protein [Zavarzinella formosa]